MRYYRGLTFVEMLVCLSIIAIIFAIATPILHSARETARTTSAVSYMHQIGKAIAIYRADWDAGGYQDMYQAGLPAYSYLRKTNLGLSSKPLVSPCGYRPGIGWDSADLAAEYVWAYDIYRTDYAGGDKILQKYQENALIVMDPRCNPAGTDWNNPYKEKRAIGLLLNGQVINRRKPGFPDDQNWWTPDAR